MLNYNHLYYFHVAASEGTLAAAAAKLGVKQSTVSEQLRSLERAVGHTLFERTPTGLRLTKAGETAYEHTTAMFRAGERLAQALGGDDEDTPTCLRVGVTSAVARATSTDFLLPLFGFEDCMPSISTRDMLDLLRDVRANELDLVLCESEPAESTIRGLEHAVIDHVPLVVIAPANKDPGPDWQDIGLVQYRAGSTFALEVEAYLEDHNLRPRIVGEADDSQLLLEAAARGGYVAIVPRTVARDALTAGRVRILAQVDAAHAAVHAIYQNGSSATLVRRAIEGLIEMAQRE
jgi:LysR family transcriptional activator of nhaA